MTANKSNCLDSEPILIDILKKLDQLSTEVEKLDQLSAQKLRNLTIFYYALPSQEAIASGNSKIVSIDF